MSERILTRNFHLPGSHTLAVYREAGGSAGLEKAFAMKPAEITEEVKRSNLRGLGGAGFPTGVKWGFLPKGHPGPIYLVINAAEGEPGTFKGRCQLERAPPALIEGMIISAYAIGAHLAFVYIRGEYVQPWRIFGRAVEEAYAAGLLGKNIRGSGFDLDVIVHRGAGAYICGEETGLISSLEGKKGWPKLKPPFPAIRGAFGAPTIVNNVETICHVPHIMNRGAAWFAGLGTKSQGGTRMYSVSGHVTRPGVYELPVSATLRSLIYEHAGGIPGGRRLKAVVPGGSSGGPPPPRPAGAPPGRGGAHKPGAAGGTPGGRRLKAVVPGGSSAVLLTADEIDATLDVDGLKNAGTMAGSAGVIVMDETVSIPEALMVVARFYAHESCGQCTPCRESTGWIYKMTRRIVG